MGGAPAPKPVRRGFQVTLALAVMAYGTALTPASFPANRVLPRTGGRFGILPEQDKDLADVLNRLRSGPSANFFKNRLAAGTIGVVHAHLDQLVTFQSAIDFSENCG